MASRIYYNARLTSAHGTNAGPQGPLPVRFDDLRPTEIVRRASDYVMSIVRFTTTLEGLPQLVVEHPPSTDTKPTATSYSFTLSGGGVTVEAPVLWMPPDSTLSQRSGDLGDPYWWEYSFIRFGALVNGALSVAMTALRAAVPSLASAPAPFFTFDVPSATWTLYQPMAALNPASFSLAANAHAEHLFAGFPTVPVNGLHRYNTFLQPNEEPVEINGKNYVTRQQTPGALANWSPIRRFVFTSTLPVQPEMTVPATPYGGTQVLGSNSQMTIITDLTPVLARGDELSFSTLEYMPTAEYRRVALMSDSPINEIAFAVYWEDDLGGLHPMYLYENGFVSLKLMLERVK